jgi:hypothetical protein
MPMAWRFGSLSRKFRYSAVASGLREWALMKRDSPMARSSTCAGTPSRRGNRGAQSQVASLPAAAPKYGPISVVAHVPLIMKTAVPAASAA